MKIVTVNTELLDNLLRINAVDSYTATKSCNKWDYEISINEEAVLSMHKDKATMTVKTFVDDYRTINLSLFHDWYIEA